MKMDLGSRALGVLVGAYAGMDDMATADRCLGSGSAVATLPQVGTRSLIVSALIAVHFVESMLKRMQQTYLRACHEPAGAR